MEFVYHQFNSYLKNEHKLFTDVPSLELVYISKPCKTPKLAWLKLKTIVVEIVGK